MFVLFDKWGKHCEISAKNTKYGFRSSRVCRTGLMFSNLQVFPVNIPETLTCVTVWKRFNEIKKLRKIMAKRHKELHLRGTMPDMKDEHFFNRYDSRVILQRKEFILSLLDFIS